LSNSQCTIGNAGSVVTSGNNLTLPVSITFASGFLSATIYGYAQDNEVNISGWQTLGTWSLAGNQPPAVVSVTPNNAGGSSQTFNATYTDPNGWSDLSAVHLLFNS